MQVFPSLGGSAAESSHDGDINLNNNSGPVAPEVLKTAAPSPASSAPANAGKEDVNSTTAAVKRVVDGAGSAVTNSDDNSSDTTDKADKLSQLREFKTLQKLANAHKSKSEFSKALELYANALDKIKAFPKEYYQERAEALKRSAICFIGNEQYDEALEAVRTAHREVAKCRMERRPLSFSAGISHTRWLVDFRKSKFCSSSLLQLALKLKCG